eukprot:m.1668210 g.1668210  ORF g.1668210 m.1668210 type:complete len:93 (-) comp151699_c0_seq1:11-289(-)
MGIDNVAGDTMLRLQEYEKFAISTQISWLEPKNEESESTDVTEPHISKSMHSLEATLSANVGLQAMQVLGSRAVASNTGTAVIVHSMHAPAH